MKFAMLAPVAAMTALTRGPIGPVRANAETRALLQSAVDEVVAVGMSLKTGLTAEDAGKIMRLVDGLPKQMMASMAHDLLAGKPIELNGLSGAVSRLGKQQGVAGADAYVRRAGAGAIYGRQAAGVVCHPGLCRNLRPARPPVCLLVPV
jgi:ketopantoate reductase